MFVKFRHSELLPFLFFHVAVFGRKSLCEFTPLRWEVNPLLVGRLSTSIVWNPSAWKTCLFSSTYLFIQLSISVWTQEYLFYPLGYNPTLFFFLKLSHLWPLGGLYLIPACLWHSIRMGLIFVSWALPYFLVLHDATGLSCIFLVSVLESASTIFWHLDHFQDF